jgi:putative addiction module component (TIGR02574 family)
MTKSAQLVLSDAMALEDGDRAELAARLLESLEPSPVEIDDSAWLAEMDRRIESSKAGQAEYGSWPDVRDHCCVS